MAVMFFMILSLLFSTAALTSYLDRRPTIAMLMAFTASMLVCTTAMAVM